jgi:hypothetical protein
VDKNGYRVPIYGENASRGHTGNADYSWLMQLRAQQAVYAPKLGEQVAPLESALIPAPNAYPAQ